MAKIEIDVLAQASFQAFDASFSEMMVNIESLGPSAWKNGALSMLRSTWNQVDNAIIHDYEMRKEDAIGKADQN